MPPRPRPLGAGWLNQCSLRALDRVLRRGGAPHPLPGAVEKSSGDGRGLSTARPRDRSHADGSCGTTHSSEDGLFHPACWLRSQPGFPWFPGWWKSDCPVAVESGVPGPGEGGRLSDEPVPGVGGGKLGAPEFDGPGLGGRVGEPEAPEFEDGGRKSGAPGGGVWSGSRSSFTSPAYGPAGSRSHDDGAADLLGLAPGVFHSKTYPRRRSSPDLRSPRT